MDYALGAILGACVGDATGAVLEFRGAVNTHDVEVWYIMRLFVKDQW